jgi:N-acetylmuramoyl-L-alanine amidase
MKIRAHRLCDDANNPFAFVASPNLGGEIVPRYLILHYTAGSSAAGTIAWFQDRASKVSAHLVVARDGSITQLVPFNRCAYHAGQSQWGSLIGLNRHSIGIEIDNAGQLIRSGGKWVSPISRRSYPDSEVAVACHKNDPPGTAPGGWHCYSAAQLEATLDASMALMREYGLADVLGHEDIAPARKRDPGPDFPLASFRARLLGRGDDHGAPYRASAELNVRSGPGTEFACVPGSPLPVGSGVAVLAQNGVWWQVDVVGSVNGINDIVGWCHSKYLSRA